MLIGIDPLLGPDLLHALASMGHGDELAIVDANFPAATMGQRIVEVRGANSPALLNAILSLFPVDTFIVPAVVTMEVVGDPIAVPAPVAEFAAVMRERGPASPKSADSIAMPSTRAHAAPSSSCAPASFDPTATCCWSRGS